MSFFTCNSHITYHYQDRIESDGLSDIQKGNGKSVSCLRWFEFGLKHHTCHQVPYIGVKSLMFKRHATCISVCWFISNCKLFKSAMTFEFLDLQYCASKLMVTLIDRFIEKILYWS